MEDQQYDIINQNRLTTKTATYNYNITPLKNISGNNNKVNDKKVQENRRKVS